MKNFLSVIFGILFGFLVLSCGSDDSELEPTIRNIDGIVTGTVSCNIEGKSLAGIEPENFELPSGLIITGTLPEDLKQEGVRISFDMKPSKNYLTTCTTFFLPEQYYDVFNVKVLPDGS